MPGMFSRAAAPSAVPLSLYRNGLGRKLRLIARPDREKKKTAREKMKTHCVDRDWKKGGKMETNKDVSVIQMRQK